MGGGFGAGLESMPGRCARLCFTGIPVSISIAPTKTLAKVAH